MWRIDLRVSHFLAQHTCKIVLLTANNYNTDWEIKDPLINEGTYGQAFHKFHELSIILTLIDKIVMNQTVGGGVWILESDAECSFHYSHMEGHMSAVDRHERCQRLLSKRKYSPNFDNVI